ncbi:Hypothetical predicted protein [Lecanosticta acicola]|uniref:Uncharacterized protein n=1 Tax=Lecanosticta acicola TaxID=111012 RepID=A0AAI8YTE8_9PEZI|nr:Hypothetical predicted protein [Lecanosticta acicola]
MKASTIFPVILLSLSPLPLAIAEPDNDYQNSLACAKRNPSINAAISAFCDKKDASGNLSNDLFVPSPYASDGKVSGGVKVSIGGSCSPKQYVPLQYCGLQFHEICKDGQSHRRFGRGGCQVWKIESGAEAIAAVLEGE